MHRGVVIPFKHVIVSGVVLMALKYCQELKPPYLLNEQYTQLLRQKDIHKHGSWCRIWQSVRET